MSQCGSGCGPKDCWRVAHITIIASAAIVLTVAGCREDGHGRILLPEESCVLSLETLAEGLACYTTQHGVITPTAIGPSGHTHVWRVLIVRYVVAKRYLAAKRKPKEFDYRFDQAWDSPHNIDSVSALEWDAFTCPSEMAVKPHPQTCTSYVMLVRPEFKDGTTP